MIGVVLGIVAGFFGACLPQRTRTVPVIVLGIGSCIAESIAAIYVLTTGQIIHFQTTLLIPFWGIDITLNPLGSFFVIIVALVAIPSLIYTQGYARHGKLISRSAMCLLPIFTTSMLMVPQAGSVVTFMVLWEIMALGSLLLVITEHLEREQVRSAGVWYGTLTHVGAVAILSGFLVLEIHNSKQTFSSLALNAHHLSPAIKTFAFLLAAFGFLSKAGAVPFHVWLPKAHPEAPSPVSALMSGAMVSLGIYGIILFGNVLLDGGSAWWWLVILSVGALSAVFGSLQAVNNTDLKRLLAYSTTDNLGLALIGVGGAGYFFDTHQFTLSSMALTACLILLINHAAFKGALFLSAGSILVATGTTNLDKLGGLQRRMPTSGILFIISAAAICALPPTNGFVSEWLLFQTLVDGSGGTLTSTTGDISILLAISSLSLTAGLTIVAMVKAVGIGFLGRPRTQEAERAVDVNFSMKLGVALLVATCILFGIAPFVLFPLLKHAIQGSFPGEAHITTLKGVNLAIINITGILKPTWLAILLVVSILILSGIRRVLTRNNEPRVAEVWGCGRDSQTSRMQYTATSFAEPVQRIFNDVLIPSHDIDVSHAEESRYFIKSAHYRNSTNDAIDRFLYQPIIMATRRWGKVSRKLQPGSIHLYLSYGLGALVVLLIVSVVMK